MKNKYFVLYEISGSFIRKGENPQCEIDLIIELDSVNELNLNIIKKKIKDLTSHSVQKILVLNKLD